MAVELVVGKEEEEKKNQLSNKKNKRNTNKRGLSWGG